MRVIVTVFVCAAFVLFLLYHRLAPVVEVAHAELPAMRTADVAATLRDLVTAGFTIAALTPEASATDISNVVVPDRLVVCMGAERVGLSEPVMAAATVRVRIPMHAGVDSLNVAAATAIACHALRRRT